MPTRGSTPRDRALPVALLVACAGVLVWSGISPYGRGTWVAEVFPVLLGAPLLALTFRRFRLTDLVYVAIFVHAVILMVGGHWTYARTPVGFWIRDLLDLSRNPWDRVGHLAQGFVPALLARELLLRLTPLRRGGWLFYIVLSICLGIAVLYEFIEWWGSLLTGAAAEDFLALQGDVWDTQWDMLLAGIGAVAAQLLLGRLHDRELARRGFVELDR
jgi:putative membrane protein